MGSANGDVEVAGSMESRGVVHTRVQHTRFTNLKPRERHLALEGHGWHIRMAFGRMQHARGAVAFSFGAGRHPWMCSPEMRHYFPMGFDF